MKITSLNCNNCGANLEINPNIKFFTCTFCKSSLTIKRSGNVMFTEVLGEIKKDTETLIDNSEQLLIEKQIARLDREWMIQSQQYQLKGNKGTTYHPESYNGITEKAGGIFGIGFAIFWIISASSMGAPGFFPLFGLVIIGIIIFQMVSNSTIKSAYDTAKSRYLNKRSRLLTELEKTKKIQ